jgi:hypothetical protein
VSFAKGVFGEGGMGGWFGIECPRINFSSLDHADFEKFQKKFVLGDQFSFREPGRPIMYGQALGAVPLPVAAWMLEECIGPSKRKVSGTKRAGGGNLPAWKTPV